MIDFFKLIFKHDSKMAMIFILILIIGNWIGFETSTIFILLLNESFSNSKNIFIYIQWIHLLSTILLNNIT